MRHRVYVISDLHLRGAPAADGRPASRFVHPAPIEDEYRIAKAYKIYIYAAHKWQSAADQPVSASEVDRVMFFLDNPAVTPRWANRYGSERDFFAVRTLIEESERYWRSRGRFLRRRSQSPPKKARTKIFICYRRDNSKFAARAIFDDLSSVYPRQIFFNNESIPAGAYFEKEIKERMEECGVLLAVIGDHWINAKYDDGPKKDELRLAGPED
jgi:TIR domain